MEGHHPSHDIFYQILSRRLWENLNQEEALTGEPNEKDPTFNEELSPDNDEVTSLELIPPPDGAVTFNDIGGQTFDYEKQVVLVDKKYLESMQYESGLGAATEMGGFSLEKGLEVSLMP